MRRTLRRIFFIRHSLKSTPLPANAMRIALLQIQSLFFASELYYEARIPEHLQPVRDFIYMAFHGALWRSFNEISFAVMIKEARRCRGD